MDVISISGNFWSDKKPTAVNWISISNSVVRCLTGVMQTHDEEMKKFFKHSSVKCVVSPRYTSGRLGLFKQQIDENLQREIINHRSLRHPNIIRFKEVLSTPTHLDIVMQYAAGGELFVQISSAGRFSEDEARFSFNSLYLGSATFI